jgi:dTDP-4-dehydrorhamnose reductase
MRITLIGTGFIGSALADIYTKRGDSVRHLGSDQIDITQLYTARDVLQGSPTDLIINTAAVTNTSLAERPDQQGLTYRVNVQGPANLSLLAAELEVPVVHFSTGMLFDGAPDHNPSGWLETDTPQPTGYYAWTKAWCESQLIPFAQEQHTAILRIHTPLSSFAHPRNFLQRLQRFDKAVDIPTSVTIVEAIPEAIDAIIHQGAYGITNTVASGSISAHQLSLLLQDAGYIEADKRIAILTRDELDAVTVASGGAHQTFPLLSTQKLASLGIEVPEASKAATQVIAALPSPQ